MAQYRKNRVDEEMLRVMASLLRTVKDPRIASSLVSVTGVDCSADLKYAKIYYSFLSTRYEEGDILAALKSASGYLRSGLARELNLRITPELRFVRDESMEKGARIDDLLKKVITDRKDGEE